MADLAKYQDIGDTLPFVPRILSRYDISYCYIVIYTDYCFVLLFHNLPHSCPIYMGKMEKSRTEWVLLSSPPKYLSKYRPTFYIFLHFLTFSYIYIFIHFHPPSFIYRNILVNVGSLYTRTHIHAYIYARTRIHVPI